jgi:prevent-host-death family protein
MAPADTADLDRANLISMAEARVLGVSGLVQAAEEGNEQVVTRNAKPVAAVISIKRLAPLQQIEEDILDVTLASARMLTTGPHRHSLDEVLAQFGYTREQLRDPDE